MTPFAFTYIITNMLLTYHVALVDIGNREQLKSLISELKILIHVGSHLNILNLLGAITKEISLG